jgi:hypothetical protein
LPPIGNLACKDFADVLKTSMSNGIAWMNNEGGAGPNNLKDPQPLERKVGVAPAQDFHLALKRRGNHCQIGFVLK